MFDGQEMIVEDITIVLGVLVSLKSFSLEFLKNAKDILKVNQSLDDFKEDFESGMYADEITNYFEENVSEFNSFYDDVNDAIIFCINLNDESIDTKTIYELKEELRCNLEQYNIIVDYSNIDIFAVEDDD